MLNYAKDCHLIFNGEKLNATKYPQIRTNQVNSAPCNELK